MLHLNGLLYVSTQEIWKCILFFLFIFKLLYIILFTSAKYIHKPPLIQQMLQIIAQFFFRYQDIAEYFATSEDDPATVIIMDPLPDHPNIHGISFMKPHHNDPSELWHKPYMLNTIIPEGLTSRDLKTLPAVEEKKPGPKMGTNVGQGLMIGSLPKPTAPMPQLKCPETLQVRHLIQYKPMSEDLRKQYVKISLFLHPS